MLKRIAWKALVVLGMAFLTMLTPPGARAGQSNCPGWFCANYLLIESCWDAEQACDSNCVIRECIEYSLNCTGYPGWPIEIWCDDP